MPSPYTNPPATRLRGPSNASMNKYVPENYQPSPQPQPSAQGYFPPQRARGPSIGDQQIASVPPVQQPGFYGTPTSLPIPQQQMQPSYPGTPMYHPQAPYPQSELRPPIEPRRLSASSARSHHSHESRRSHHSHRSASSRGPEPRSREHDDDRKERRHNRRHSHDGTDRELSKQAKDHRPTLGDTIFGIFDTVKMALEPRDKY